MDFFVWALFTVLGGSLGALVTSKTIKNKLAKEEEQKELERQTERLGFADQLEGMRNKMSAVREEGKEYWEQLQAKIKECRLFEEQAKTLPGLEENIISLRKNNDALEQHKKDLLAKVQEAEEALDIEKKVLEDCLIFVKGSHFLPGSVVQDMMEQAKKHTSQAEG